MRFLSIYSHPERDTPPTEQEMAAMGQLIAEWSAAGKLVATEGCLPTRLGAKVRRAGDRVTATDGPFSEAKEVVGGFAIMECESLEEAKELTRRFLAVAGDGECELRQLYQEPAL